MDQLATRLKEAERHLALNEGRTVAHSKLENSGTAAERESYIRAVAGAAQKPR